MMLSLFRRRRKEEPQHIPQGRLVALALYVAARGLGEPKKPGLRVWRGRRVEAYMYVGKPRIYAGRVHSDTEIEVAHYVSWCARDYKTPVTLHVRVTGGDWPGVKLLRKAKPERVARALSRLSQALADTALNAWNLDTFVFTAVDGEVEPKLSLELDRCGLKATLVSIYPAVYASLDLALRGR